MTEENNENTVNNSDTTPPSPQPQSNSNQPVQPTQGQPVYPAQQVPPQQQAQNAYPPPPPGQVPPQQQNVGAYPPPPGQAAQPYYAQPPVPPVAPPSNGKAIASLILGILAILASPSVFFGVIFGVVAIILGVMAVKKPEKDSKATAGKVCGILGVIFSILLMAFYILAFGVWSANVGDRYYSSSSSSSGSQSVIEDITNEADEQDVIDQAKTVYDGIKNPSAEKRAELAADYNDEFKDIFGFTMAEAGIDPDEVLQVTLDSITYNTPSAYVYSDGTASTSTTVYSLDIWSIIYDTSVEIKTRSDAGEIFDVSTAEGKAKVGDIFKTVMTTTEALPTSSSLEFEKSGDTWKVTSDSLEDSIEYIFGTY